MKKKGFVALGFLAAALLGGGAMVFLPLPSGDSPETASSPANEAEDLLEQARSLVRTSKNGDVEYTAASFPLFLRAAESGNADAQYAVGKCYDAGLKEAGVQKNEIRAAEWYARAAAQGHALAMQRLADCYLGGMGVLEDAERGFDLLNQSLAAGNPGALKPLAYCYFYGRGVEPDGEKAIEYSLRACEHGDNCLSFFWVDREEFIFKAEASTPFVKGGMELAARYVCFQMRMYLASRLPGEELPEQPRQLLARCIELARQGDGEAAYRVARCFETGYFIDEESGDVDGMDGDQALAYYAMALEAGYEAAMIALGQMHEYSPYICKDESLCDFWYRRAAECGNSCAAGRVVHLPPGRPVDDAFALDCCRASALNPESGSARRLVEETVCSGKVSMEVLRYLAGRGNREVMAYLGECYEQGLQGEAPDVARAVLCYRRAADQGSPRAQFRLGCCYAEGRGVPKDLQRAVALFEQAAKAEIPQDDVDVSGEEFGLWSTPYYGALRELATCYAQGLGVEKSLPRAIELYLKAGTTGEEQQIRDKAVGHSGRYGCSGAAP